jgi:hypothetical protein
MRISECGTWNEVRASLRRLGSVAVAARSERRALPSGSWAGYQQSGRAEARSALSRTLELRIKLILQYLLVPDLARRFHSRGDIRKHTIEPVLGRLTDGERAVCFT